MRVLIVGGGIAGLAAAFGLVRAGADVTVIERRPRAAASGAGLSLLPNGIAAIRALGLADVVADLTGGQAPAGGGIRGVDGRWLRRVGPDAVAGLRVVHRAELHERLVAALPPTTVRFGVEAGLHDPQRGIVAADGTATRADLVVGADGIRSACRARLGLGPGLRWAGYGAWRGVTSGPVAGVDPAETWGRGRRLGLVPLPDGRVYWFAVERRRGAPAGDQRAAVLRRFGDWHDPAAAVIEATRAESVTWTDIHDLARPLPTFIGGRVALAGDAAHAMTPDLGQGGNQALEDAATLAAVLAAPLDSSRSSSATGSPGEADLRAALRRYDEERLARTRAVARASRQVGALAQAAHPLAVIARDGGARAAPRWLEARAMARLAQWSPPEERRRNADGPGGAAAVSPRPPRRRRRRRGRVG